MGYNLQRFSPLTQINKDTAKNLVPVWNYSLADDRSEESQPIVYQGVIYITTHRRHDGGRRQDRQADLEDQGRISAGDAAHRLLRHHQSRRRDLRRQGVPHHARCQCHRARRQDRQGTLAPEGGRHQGRLFDDGGAAGRRRRRHDRHLRRRVRHPRLHRRLGSGRPASICGAPIRFRARTSRAATPGRATPGSSAADRPGSPAPTIPS